MDKVNTKSRISKFGKIFLIFLSIAFIAVIFIYFRSFLDRKLENEDAKTLFNAAKQGITLENFDLKTEIGQIMLNSNNELKEAQDKYLTALKTTYVDCYKSINDVKDKECLTKYNQSFEKQKGITNDYYTEFINLITKQQKNLNDWAIAKPFSAKKEELAYINQKYEQLLKDLNDHRKAENDKFTAVVTYGNFLLQNHSQIKIVNNRIKFNSAELQAKLNELIKNNLALQKIAEDSKDKLLDDLDAQLNEIQNSKLFQ